MKVKLYKSTNNVYNRWQVRDWITATELILHDFHSHFDMDSIRLQTFDCKWIAQKRAKSPSASTRHHLKHNYTLANSNHPVALGVQRILISIISSGLLIYLSACPPCGQTFPPYTPLSLTELYTQAQRLDRRLERHWKYKIPYHLS